MVKDKRSEVSHSTKPVGQDLVGVMVFALGVGALIAVGFWAYLQFSGSGSREAQLARDTVNRRGAVSLSDDRAGAEEAAFQGVWEARFEGGASAVLALQDGDFQLIFTESPDARLRRYSLGSYEFDMQDSVLRLMPQPSLQPRAEKGFEYKVLTNRRYRFDVAFDPAYPGKLLIKPHIIPGLYDQVHPLFFTVGQYEDYTLWSRI